MGERKHGVRGVPRPAGPEDMASPYNDMLIAVLVGLGALVALLGVVLYWRNRQLHELRQVGDRVASRRATAISKCASVRTPGEDAAELALNVDRMMERLQREHSTRSDREAVLRRLVESMHEAIAVERDGILLANARFAELCGATARAARRPAALRTRAPRFCRAPRRAPAPPSRGPAGARAARGRTASVAVTRRASNSVRAHQLRRAAGAAGLGGRDELARRSAHAPARVPPHGRRSTRCPRAC